jgi:hypothetical protein
VDVEADESAPAVKKKLKLAISGYLCINEHMVVWLLHLMTVANLIALILMRTIVISSLININGLSSGPSQVEEKRDAHYEQLNSVMGKYSFGRQVLPVALVTSPEEKYRARVAKQENVDSLEKSMVQFGTLNEHVEVVLFLGPNKPLPPKLGFKPPAAVEDMKSRGFEGYFTIVGDHTQRAMNQLHAKFSKNPQWANVEARLFVCPRSEEVYGVLKSWGILHNIKGEKRVTVSFHDKVTTLHADYESLKLHEGEAGHKERTAAVKEARRMDFGKISTGQMTQLWSIAARSGKVWKLLLKIIAGDVVAPEQEREPTPRARQANVE